MADAYIGMDPSLTAFGVAAISDGYQKSWLLKPKKVGVDRLLEISYLLGDVFTEVGKDGYQISDVAIEDTVRASYAASALGELAAVVKMTCHQLLSEPGKYPIKVPPMTLKKYATGRGNAKKIEILLSVYKKWGVEFRDDNEADAYVLARIASGYAQTLYEKEIISKLADTKFRDGGL